MNKNVLPVLAKSVLALLVAVGTATSFAQAKKEVTFAHQDMQLPYRILMDAELEKATGYKINWRMFGGGGEVIKAMSSGDVQIGEVGSSPLATATSQGQDLRLVYILDDIAASDQLISRNGSGINGWKDLVGKKSGHAIRVHSPLLLDGGHAPGRCRCQERQRDEPASARHRCGLGAW